MKRILKHFLAKAAAVTLSATVLLGGSIGILPQVTESGIVAQAVNADRDFMTKEVYNQYADENGLAITGYRGTDPHVVIPSTLFGKKVVEINSFAENTVIESVQLPDGCAEIDSWAFKNCTNLKTVVIPNSVVYMGYSVFENCTSLVNVTLPEKLISSYSGGSGMFDYCTSLTSITIPGGWKDVPEWMFRNCKNLKHVTICEGVERIGQEYDGHVFYQCKSLESVSFPDSVKEFSSNNFVECTSLKKITLPKNLIRLPETFSYCTALQEVIVGEKTEKIASSAIRHCENLQKVVIPPSVTKIENNAILKKECPKVVIWGKAGSEADRFAASADLPFNEMIDPTGISLNTSNLELKLGSTYTLSAIVKPDTAYDSSVTWKSSDTKVATVNNGLVTAKGYGTATITARTVNNKTATCQVTVICPPANVTLSQTSLTLNKGNSTVLKATVSPDSATDKTITWSSSDSSVATVSRGTVKAVNVGTATITARTVNNKTATCKVKVINPATDIILNRTSLTIEQGENFALIATVIPEDAVDTTVTWRSSNTSIVTVTEGYVTGINPGTAVITAKTTDGLTAFCTVIVTGPVTKVNLSQTSLSLNKGEAAMLTATVIPTNAKDKTITWFSSNPSVASVDNGYVTAVNTGTASITAMSSNGITASCLVTVTNSVTGISLNRTSLSLNKGKTATLIATITPADADQQTISWFSSNSNVATVADGIVTANGSGSATITAQTANGLTATCKVTVTNPVVKVTLNKTVLSLAKGNSATLTATITPADADQRTVNWTSSNTTVATVSGGKVTARNAGTATITAKTANGKYAACKVTVTVPVTNVSFNITSATLGKGETLTLKATVTPSDAGNKTVTWTSSNTTVATVSGGKITAKNTGTATITAKSSNGKTASCKITVKAAASRITLNKTSLTMGVGETFKFISSITDGASYKRTFTSSDTSILMITATTTGTCTVKALKTGTATITVRTFNGKTASCKVTVKAAASKITISPTQINLKVGQTYKISSSVTDGASYYRYFWSTDTSVASIQSRTTGTCTIKALKKGTCQIKVKTYNGKTAACTVTVS